MVSGLDLVYTERKGYEWQSIEPSLVGVVYCLVSFIVCVIVGVSL